MVQCRFFSPSIFTWVSMSFSSVVFSCFFCNWETTVSFVLGAFTSIICGWIGMQIAVYTNVRTAHQSWANLGWGFDVAIQGGCVMGLSLVSIGLFNLFALVKALQKTSTLVDEELY